MAESRAAPRKSTFKIRGPAGTGPLLAAWWPDRAADAAFDVVFAWAVVRAVGDPTQAALLLSVAFIPQIILTIPAGTMGDRWGLALTARWTLVARACVMALLGASLLGDRAPVALLIAVGVLVSLLDSFHIPAMHGLQGQLAGDSKDAQNESQAAMQGVSRIAQVIGSVAVGALLGLHAALPMAVCATLLVLALIPLARVGRLEPQQGELTSTVLEDIRSGTTAARGIAGIGMMLGVLAASNALSAAPILFAIPLRSEEFAWPAWSYAVAYGAFAIGSVTGALCVNRRSFRWSYPVRIGVLSNLPAAAGIAVIALSESPWGAAFGALVSGLSFALSAPLLMGQIKAAMPREHQGFASAVLDVAVFSFIPVGHVVFGFFAGAWSSGVAGLLFAAGLALFTACASTSAAVRSETPRVSRAGRA